VRQIVIEADLDIIIYADSLSDPLSYFLQFGRLAPIQCLFWGNPITSGKPAVDYFISGDRMEHPSRTMFREYQHIPSSSSSSSSLSVVEKLKNKAEILQDDKYCHDMKEDNCGDYYSEQVVLLAGQGIWYEKPTMPTDWLPRSHFGIYDDESSDSSKKWTVYMCAQSLFKLHPSFDFVIRDILMKDPNGVVVFTKDRREKWNQLFMKRLKRNLLLNNNVVWHEAEKLNDRTIVLDDNGRKKKANNGRDADKYVTKDRIKSLSLEEANHHIEQVLSSGRDHDNKVKYIIDEDEDEDAEEDEDEASNNSREDSLWRRVKLVNRQPPDDFIKLLKISDVILHPFPFDGSRTASEGLFIGKPTITLPSNQVCCMYI
jgi:hypothetical protein